MTKVLQPNVKFRAYVAYEDSYVQPLILSALSSLCVRQECTLLDEPISNEKGLCAIPYLQISTYESISHSTLFSKPVSYFANSYIIRKALIRKHFLAHTIESYTSKNSGSLLSKHVPLTLPLELDYAEFLDEALLEAYELHGAWARNEKSDPSAMEWWILKPSMSDKGEGIRIFSSESELRTIFEEWEASSEDEDDEAYTQENDDGIGAKEAEEIHDPDQTSASTGAGMTSQLRHFVVQPYIKPLLFRSVGNRKFHVRSYVLSLGALQVYLFREMLALFAEVPYEPPSRITMDDMAGHLTNTGLQNGNTSESVHHFWSLPSQAPMADSTHLDWKSRAFDQVKTLTAELFKAASAQPTTFQAIPNAFELFGIDWLVDEKGDVWLLEVNAFPDFKQTGEGLQQIIEALWIETIELVVKQFFHLGKVASSSKMEKVLGLDLGRG